MGKEFNLTEQFGSAWDRLPSEDKETEEKDIYVERRVQDALTKTPDDLINNFKQEIIGIETNRNLREKEFFKHAGYKHGGATSSLGKTKQKEFDKQFGAITEIETVTPESINVLPLDLIYDAENDSYYSKERDLYYDKETVETLLNL